MDSTDTWCLKVLEKWSLLHPVNILGHISVFWPNYPHLVSKQAQSQNSRGAGRRNVQKGIGALRISKGASCPWQNPLSVKAVSHSCVGKRFSKHTEEAHESKCKMQIWIQEVWAGAWESAFRRLLACTPHLNWQGSGRPESALPQDTCIINSCLTNHLF